MNNVAERIEGKKKVLKLLVAVQRIPTWTYLLLGMEDGSSGVRSPYLAGVEELRSRAVRSVQRDGGGRGASARRLRPFVQPTICLGLPTLVFSFPRHKIRVVRDWQ